MEEKEATVWRFESRKIAESFMSSIREWLNARGAPDYVGIEDDELETCNVIYRGKDVRFIKRLKNNAKGFEAGWKGRECDDR